MSLSFKRKIRLWLIYNRAGWDDRFGGNFGFGFDDRAGVDFCVVSDSGFFFQDASGVNHNIGSDKNTIFDHNLITDSRIVSNAADANGAIRTDENMLTDHCFR